MWTWELEDPLPKVQPHFDVGLDLLHLLRMILPTPKVNARQECLLVAEHSLLVLEHTVANIKGPKTVDALTLYILYLLALGSRNLTYIL